jgi:phage recombination protein Bet
MNALQKLPEQNQDIASRFNPEELQLITDTVAKGATPDELRLFLHRCNLLHLNPLKPGQIHFVKYSASSPGTIVVGIEGFRSLAARTGKLSGISRGAIREGGKLIGAWAEVTRSDWKNPAREEVPLSEYNTGKGPWAKMPETMIKKVAEAAALRMAFPDDLGGVYERSEMNQEDPNNDDIDQPRRRIFADQPGADEGDGSHAAPKVVIVDHRKQLGIEINSERARLGWDKEKLGQFIIEGFGKPGNELSESEMGELIETLERMES